MKLTKSQFAAAARILADRVAFCRAEVARLRARPMPAAGSPEAHEHAAAERRLLAAEDEAAAGPAYR